MTKISSRKEGFSHVPKKYSYDFGKAIEVDAGHVDCRTTPMWKSNTVKNDHYRTHDQKEVEVVLESSSGKVVGIEIKLSSIVRKEDLKGLVSLKEHCGDDFHKGIIFYMGDKPLPFGESFTALPITALWK